jgi:hypothetical protein
VVCFARPGWRDRASLRTGCWYLDGWPARKQRREVLRKGRGEVIELVGTDSPQQHRQYHFGISASGRRVDVLAGAYPLQKRVHIKPLGPAGAEHQRSQFGGSSMTRCRACGTDIRSASGAQRRLGGLFRAGSLDAQQLLHCGHEPVTGHGRLRGPTGSGGATGMPAVNRVRFRSIPRQDPLGSRDHQMAAAMDLSSRRVQHSVEVGGGALDVGVVTLTRA